MPHRDIFGRIDRPATGSEFGPASPDPPTEQIHTGSTG